MLYCFVKPEKLKKERNEGGKRKVKIRADQIERLEEKFGADHIHVEGRQRRSKRFDDEESSRPRNYDVKRRTVAPVATIPPTVQTTTSAPTAPLAPTTTPAPAITRPQTATLPATAARTVVTATARTSQKEGGRMITQQQPLLELEPCPICGGLKEKQREMNGRTVQLLTCGSCSGAYKAYVDEATKAIVADPANAPEPMKKFQWALSKINLPNFRAEAEAAVIEYRRKYNTTVMAVLRQRGYLNGEPTWGQESHFRRPQMRFTQETFQSGVGLAVSRQLEEGLDEAYKLMRRVVGRAEAAARVEPELRAAIAKNPATAETKTPAETATAAPTETKEEPPATKPVARKKAAKAAK